MTRNSPYKKHEMSPHVLCIRRNLPKPALSSTSHCRGALDLMKVCNQSQYLFITKLLRLSPHQSFSNWSYKTYKLISLKGERQPVCEACHSPLTVKHFLVDCTHYSAARHRYFGVDTLKDVFENVASCNVVAYVKDINRYVEPMFCSSATENNFVRYCHHALYAQYCIIAVQYLVPQMSHVSTIEVYLHYRLWVKSGFQPTNAYNSSDDSGLFQWKLGDLALILLDAFANACQNVNLGVDEQLKRQE